MGFMKSEQGEEIVQLEHPPFSESAAQFVVIPQISHQ